MDYYPQSVVLGQVVRESCLWGSSPWVVFLMVSRLFSSAFMRAFNNVVTLQSPLSLMRDSCPGVIIGEVVNWL